MRYRFVNHRAWLDPKTTIEIKTIDGRICVTADDQDISSWNVDGQVAQMPRAAANALATYLRYHLSQPNPVTELHLLAIVFKSHLYWVARDCTLTRTLVAEPPGYALWLAAPTQEPFPLGFCFASNTARHLASSIKDAFACSRISITPDLSSWRSNQSIGKEARLLRLPFTQATYHTVGSINLWFLVINTTGAVFWRGGEDCYVNTNPDLDVASAYSGNMLSHWEATTAEVFDAVVRSGAIDSSDSDVITVFDDANTIIPPSSQYDRTTTTYTLGSD